MPSISNNVNHIPFNQLNVIINLDSKNHKELSDINNRFGGLCEIICNRVLIDNSLGKENDLDSLKNRITVERINTEEVKNSHLLKVYSVFRRIIAFFFGIYPDNIFSYKDQWKLVKNNKVNTLILNTGLKNIKENETLKLEVFQKNIFGFSGHALLIKKTTNDNYIFFDPNSGEHRGLSFKELSNRINDQLKLFNGTDIFITKGDQYLKKIKK